MHGLPPQGDFGLGGVVGSASGSSIWLEEETISVYSVEVVASSGRLVGCRGPPQVEVNHPHSLEVTVQPRDFVSGAAVV